MLYLLLTYVQESRLFPGGNKLAKEDTDRAYQSLLSLSRRLHPRRRPRRALYAAN
jgi:hypothetical protein